MSMSATCRYCLSSPLMFLHKSLTVVWRRRNAAKYNCVQTTWRMHGRTKKVVFNWMPRRHVTSLNCCSRRSVKAPTATVWLSLRSFAESRTNPHDRVSSRHCHTAPETLSNTPRSVTSANRNSQRYRYTKMIRWSRQTTCGVDTARTCTATLRPRNSSKSSAFCARCYSWNKRDNFTGGTGAFAS